MVDTTSSKIVYDTKNLQKISDNFYQELVSSSLGKKTSLAFIRNEIVAKSIIPNDEFYQVMSIGGSNFEMAKAVKKNGHIFITDYKRKPVGVLSSKEKFLSLIEKNLDDNTKFLGLNFAYPVEPVTRGQILDAKLLYGSKEHKFTGLIDQLVGQTIEDYLKDNYNRDLSVSVANDTICLLLSGLEEEADRNNLIAGIVGTGKNFALFLDNDTAINLESGNFDKFDMSPSGKFIDENSNDPGVHKYEKEISGAYLFQHFNHIVQQIDKNHKLLDQSIDLERIINSGDTNLKRIAESLIEKSAQLIAAEIAAIYNFKKANHLTLIMEGSIYWKAHNYKQSVDKALEKLNIDPTKINIIRFEHSTLIGASRLM